MLAQRLYSVCLESDVWSAFVTQMPKYHSNLKFCTIVCNVLAIKTPYPLHYTIFYYLFTSDVITDEVFLDYCRLLPRIVLINLINSCNDSIVIMLMLKAIYPYIPVDRLNRYNELIEFALQHGDFNLLSKVPSININITSITSILVNYPDYTTDVLELLIDVKHVSCCDLYDFCDPKILHEVIKLSTKLLNVSVKDFFLQIFSREPSNINVNAFHKAGLTKEELLDLCLIVKSSVVIKWLNENI